MVVYEYSYDNNGKPLSIHFIATDSKGDTISNWLDTFDYDIVGRITRIVLAWSDIGQPFRYQTFLYKYDSVGLREHWNIGHYDTIVDTQEIVIYTYNDKQLPTQMKTIFFRIRQIVQ